MEIKVFKDLDQFTLTSSITKEDIALLKKYQPDALKITDKDGNDVFSLSFNEDRPSVCAFGVTFGSAEKDTGRAMIIGTLPKDLKNPGEYIADKVGAALPYINRLEASVPVAVASIKEARQNLIATIKEA